MSGPGRIPTPLCKPTWCRNSVLRVPYKDQVQYSLAELPSSWDPPCFGRSVDLFLLQRTNSSCSSIEHHLCSTFANPSNSMHIIIALAYCNKSTTLIHIFYIPRLSPRRAPTANEPRSSRSHSPTAPLSLIDTRESARSSTPCCLAELQLRNQHPKPLLDPKHADLNK